MNPLPPKPKTFLSAISHKKCAKQQEELFLVGRSDMNSSRYIPTSSGRSLQLRHQVPLVLGETSRVQGQQRRGSCAARNRWRPEVHVEASRRVRTATLSRTVSPFFHSLLLLHSSSCFFSSASSSSSSSAGLGGGSRTPRAHARPCSVLS